MTVPTRILVTGATGFLGGHTARTLSEEGFDIVATGRNASRGTKLQSRSIRFVPADLRSPSDLIDVCAEIDTVIHCAALSTAWAHPSSLFQTMNIDGTRHLLFAARKTGVRRFIHVSTPAVISRFAHQYDLTEEEPLPDEFTSLYGATKAVAERLVLDTTDMETAVFRPKAIYGPGDTALLPRLVEAAASRRLPVIGDGTTLTDLTHVEDVVAALQLAVTSEDVDGIYHVAGPEAVNLWEMLETLLPLLGHPPPQRQFSVERAMRIAAAMEATWKTLRLGSEPPLTRYKVAVLAYSQTLDTSRAQRELGYQPSVTLEAGLESVLATFESHLSTVETVRKLPASEAKPGVKVEVRNSGTVHPPGVAIGRASMRRTALPILTGLITHPDHGTVVYDTGYPTTADNRRPTLFQRSYAWFIDPHPQVPSDEPDPSVVVISHGDPDHIGGLDRYPDAEIVMAPETWDDLTQTRVPWRTSQQLPPGLASRIRFVDVASGPVDLFGDNSVIALSLPGHAPGHLGLLVEADRRYLFCGDAALTRSDIERGRLGTRRLIASDPRGAQATIRMLHREGSGTVMVPSHCPQTAAQFLGDDWPNRITPNTEAPQPTTSQALFVIVPAYNEQQRITDCLDALSRQTDPDFTLIVVDNKSTDETRTLAENWIKNHPEIDVRLIDEPQKGTGAAADTGFRHAIAQGADWIARTDADCLPAPNWVETIRDQTPAMDMLGGKTRHRTDEPLDARSKIVTPATVTAARIFGRIRPSNRGSQYRCPYVMCVGNNLAVRATTYEASGGFPRLAIEELPIPNDRALVNRVRLVSGRVRYAPEMVVYNSARRLRAYGLARTLRWYANHTLDTSRFEVDVR